MKGRLLHLASAAFITDLMNPMEMESAFFLPDKQPPPRWGNATVLVLAPRGENRHLFLRN